MLLAYLCIAVMLSPWIRGPVRYLHVSWLLSYLPVGLGLLQFQYFDPHNPAFDLIIIGYLLSFGAGALYMWISSPKGNDLVLREQAAAPTKSSDSQAAALIWWIAVAATAFQSIDFLLLGAGLDDLSNLRETFQLRTSTPFTLASNVTSWACLYCYAFAIFYRGQLHPTDSLKFVLPAAGFFLIAVFSAGRQAAFQLMLMTISLLAVRRADTVVRDRETQGPSRVKSFLLVISVAAVSVIYMGYVAVNRNDGAIDYDKSIVLMQIFHFKLGEPMEWIRSWAPPDAFAAMLEAMVYFGSSISLFSEFTDIPKLSEFDSYGAMTFPFLMRQLEWLTGISVIGALSHKIDLMYALGSMGNGWTTGFSSYILDYGWYGSFLAAFVQGCISQYVWITANRRRSFHWVLLCALVLVGAVYTPFLLASAETNLFLLFVVCAFILYFRPGRA